MKKLTYNEFRQKMREFNDEHGIRSQGVNDKRLYGVMVFTEDSFAKEYSLLERSYITSNNNKAWIAGMGGYSIFASCLDRVTDQCFRVSNVMAAEHGGKDGWEVDYCYLCDKDGNPLEE